MKHPVFWLSLWLAALALPGRAQTAEASNVVGVKALVGADVQVREDYRIAVNGQEIFSDVPPVESRDAIFVPIRFVSEALRADVSWDAARQAVTIRQNGRTVRLAILQPEALVGGAVVRLAAPPFVYQGRTMLPLRWVAESLGSEVQEGRQAMEIRTPEAPEASAGPQKDSQGWRKVPPLMVGIDIVGWGIGLAALAWQTRAAMRAGTRDLTDKWVLAFILLAVTPATLLLQSSFWTAAVPIGAALTGLMSREAYADKLVTIANAAQGLGLLFTLVGLGLIIGPAIAEHNVEQIGLGVSVKIQATITGLFLSLVMNALVAKRSRSDA
ncbi:MAG: copper amine oxidase N-terminal domain-containing protein [Armatimonadetes bacterium]|nr:copper amine oxidase N-terminal domain-containing protein [Armatimonadota bacterium]